MQKQVCLLIFNLGLLLSLVSYGEELKLKEVQVLANSNSNHRQQQISLEGVNSINRRSLFDVLDVAQGVETQVSCAFCGSKRVTINGHRGEHTTLLVDGLSLHSSVSSFYGIDSIPLAGIESIDVFRGAGNTSIYPEGLAGVVNIKTAAINYDQTDIITELTHRGDYNLQLIKRSKLSERWGILIGGQSSFKNYWDQDSNQIAELPLQRGRHGLLKLQFTPDADHTLSVRFQSGHSQTRGGHLQAPFLSKFPNKIIDQNDFENGDIKNNYIGLPEHLGDQVGIQRDEMAVNYYGRIGSTGWDLSLASGWARQKQDSIYSHGYDYNNDDRIHNSRFELKKLIDNDWMILLGADYKHQIMNSESEYLYQILSLAPDNFLQEQKGYFSEFSYQGWNEQELKVTLRSQSISTLWRGSQSQREDQVLVPKLQYSYLSDDYGHHYLSIGRGYRSPLSLFESQHGTDHYGFIVNLNSIETSQHIGYGFIKQTGNSTLSFNWHHSRIFNMAYGLDQAISSEPTVFTNSDQTFDLQALDLEWGQKVFKQNDLFLRLENYIMPDQYTKKLPVAAVELKAQLEHAWLGSNYKLQSFINWQAGQDLTRYAGYPYHFNQVQEITDMADERFPGVIAGDQKRQRSPDIVTIDIMYSYFISDNSTLFLGIQNLLDTTQVSFGDSPLTWHIHGAHYHLDNFHIWGPLRGREFVVRLQSIF